MTTGHAWRLVVVAAVVVAALGFATAAQAAWNVSGSTGTLTVDSPGDNVTISQSGTTLHIAGDASGTASTSTATRLVIDFNNESNATVTLDGLTGDPIALANSIEARNAGTGAALRLKGTISTTADGGSISLGVPTQLIGATQIVEDSNMGILTTSRAIDGAYALTVTTGFWYPSGGIGVTTPLTSLDVTAFITSAAGTIATSGVQTWHNPNLSESELTLNDADVTLRASRVTHDGGVSCQGCAATRTLTLDVSEVKTGGAPGSVIRDLGGESTDPQDWTYRLVKAGTGTLSFGAGAYRNAYSGGTEIDAGTVEVGVARVFATGAVVIAENGTLRMNANLTQPAAFQVDGTLDLGAQDLTLYVDALSGSGAIRCALSSCGDLTVMTTDTSGATAFGGSFGGDGTGTLGNFGLVKAGAGLLVLAGISHHHGTTAVDAGGFRVTGTIGTGLSVGTVTVAAGARLSGWGDVGGDAFGNGLGISSSGVIDLRGLVEPETMSTAALGLSGGTLEIAVASATSYSRLWVANFVMLTSDPTLRVDAGAGLADGDVVTIVRKTSPEAVTGTFAGLAEGATVTPVSGTGTFRISYVGGDGNDITLTYVAPRAAPVPTPNNDAAPAAGGNPVTARVRTPSVAASGTLSTRVTVPGAGTVGQVGVVAGTGRVAARYCAATAKARKAGAVRIACAPTRAMRARLRSGPLTVVVTTTFAPTGGRAAVIATQRVTIPRRA